MRSALQQRIQDRSAKVAVVGLGYVGLPVACLFAEAGFPVTGIRRRQTKVDMINQGICPIEGQEPGLAELLTRVAAEGRLRATTDYESCRNADVLLVAVETPVDPDTRKPAYEALREALQSLAPRLQQGAMVIVESTIAPRTMELTVRPLLEQGSGLEAGEDFHLVNCPERVMPGKLLANIRHCHRVVGGCTPEAAALAVQFYRHVVQADLDPVDCLTAELVKTMENAYRDVQIAFANEMALLCEDLGADVWRVRELVNKAPYRAMHLPGAGVGGHCIPKDPWLLIANATPGFEAPLTRTARAVNDGMPIHMAELTIEALREAGREVAGARVAVLGYAYLENSDDTRNTPTEPFVAQLEQAGAQVVIHDPFVAPYTGDWRAVVQGADAVVIMVAHGEYRGIQPQALAERLRTPVLVDGRNVFQPVDVQEAGLTYRAIGRGEVQVPGCGRAAEAARQQPSQDQVGAKAKERLGAAVSITETLLQQTSEQELGSP